MNPLEKDKIHAIALVGGTHGNELTGVHLIRQWNNRQQSNQWLSQQFPSLQIETLLANEPAISANKRYLEKDLNRCFKMVDLADNSLELKEQVLARQINQMLGPKGKARVDFIIDLHTSTAKMQTNIVLIKMDAFHLQLAAYLKAQLPDVVITSESKLMTDHHFLCSIAQKSLVIEVGPIPQGALEANVYHQTEAALEACLKFVEYYNAEQLEQLNLPEQLEVMSYFQKLYFPVDELGQMSAMLAQYWIRNDFAPIKNGDPLFITFDGKTIAYEGVDAHVAFVNEAAYYDQGIAVCLCNPICYSIKTLAPIAQ